MKPWGWLLALGMAAVVVAVILAPIVVQLVVLLGGEWAPDWPLRLAAHLGYEAAIWWSGLAFWLIARRQGWLMRLSHALALVLVAPIAESTLAISLGRMPPGLSTLPGIVVQALVASLTFAMIYRTRSTATETQPSI